MKENQLDDDECGVVDGRILNESDTGFAAMLARLAGRYAAKEALMKALGTGLAQGVSWQDIAIISGPAGAPEIRLKGRAAELAGSGGMKKAHVSISHSDVRAVAVVVLEKE